MMKLPAFSDRYPGILTIVGFTYLVITFSLGFWYQHELNLVFATAGAHATKYQPVAIEAKGLMFYVSQDLAAKYQLSEQGFTGAIYGGLIIGIMLIIINSVVSHAEKTRAAGKGGGGN